MLGKRPKARRQTSACQSCFLDRGGSQRTNNWRAYLHPLRIGELFKHYFESWIRFTNAVGVLNNRFAICKESRDGKCHRSAMIAETRHACSVQGRWTMNFETISHFGNLRAHSAQIVRDCGDAIALFHTQFLGMANDRCTICQGACYCQYRQLVNELRHFFALNDGAFERDTRNLDNSARLKLTDIFNGFAHLRAHSQQYAE